VSCGHVGHRGSRYQLFHSDPANSVAERAVLGEASVSCQAATRN